MKELVPGLVIINSRRQSPNLKQLLTKAVHAMYLHSNAIASKMVEFQEYLVWLYLYTIADPILSYPIPSEVVQFSYIMFAL